MLDGQRYLFTERTDSFGRVSTMPYLPLTLSNGNKSLEVMALLDTGASVNVLPYQIGLQLGAVWQEQTVPNCCLFIQVLRSYFLNLLLFNNFIISARILDT